MPDVWTVRSTAGELQLNPSFSATQYQPGGVDTNALVRRDDRATYQRSGDGLRAPGPFILRGFVQRDDRDLGSMWTELEAIREVVRFATSVERSTSAGVTTYSGFQGGSTPVVTPDGLGGFVVELEFWPGRASATFLPASVDCASLLAGAVEYHMGAAGPITHAVAVPVTLVAGDLVVFTFAGLGTLTSVPAGFSNLNGTPASLDAIGTSMGASLWAFSCLVEAPFATFDVSGSDFGGYSQLGIVRGTGLSVAGVIAEPGVSLSPGTPLSVSGASPAAGVQVFFGAYERVPDIS